MSQAIRIVLLVIGLLVCVVMALFMMDGLTARRPTWPAFAVALLVAAVATTFVAGQAFRPARRRRPGA